MVGCRLQNGEKLKLIDIVQAIGKMKNLNDGGLHKILIRLGVVFARNRKYYISSKSYQDEESNNVVCFNKYLIC